MKKSLLVILVLMLFILAACSSEMKNKEKDKKTNEIKQNNSQNDKKVVVQENKSEVKENNNENQPEQSNNQEDKSKTSFFISSTGFGSGDLGGLSGADEKCSSLASAAGLPSGNWKAYLSTNSENAKDRIGSGPWYNIKGQMVSSNLQSLHSAGLKSDLIYDEKGNSILDSTGNSLIKKDHDVLTGSSSDGTVAPFPNNPGAPNPNCNGWSNGNGDWNNGPYAFVGHADWSANDQEGPASWNAAHEAPCSREGLASTGGSGKLYCFKSN